MAKKWLQAIDKLAKKGSMAGGKLGIISKAVDAIIPDATSESVKNTKSLGDTNTGSTDAGTVAVTNATTDKQDQAALLAAMAAEVASKKDDSKTWQQKWGGMPLWAKGSIIAVGAGLLWLLIRSMKGGSRMRRKY